jgi:hypothetical protein
VGAAETEVPQLPADYELPIVRYVTVAASARPSALRKLLDELDPPSAVIVARDEVAAGNATHTLRTLGYHQDDKSINVARGEIGNTTTHTVIFYQPPVTPAELQRIAVARPVQVVALTAPGEVAWLRELARGRLAPLNLYGPERRARDRDEAVREELRSVLSQGITPREVIALEPLLREFDATELVAAALNILARERAKRRAAEANPGTAAKQPAVDGLRQRPDQPRSESHGERGERPRGDRPDRGERPRGDRPDRGERPRGDRPDRGSFGSRGGSPRGRPDARRGGPDRPDRGGPPRRDRGRP